MVKVKVRKRGSLKIDVVFSEVPLDGETNGNVELSRDFKWDLSPENLEHLFLNIQEIDGTIKRQFERDGQFVWKLNLEDASGIRNRFISLFPHVFVSKSLNGKLYPFQREGRDWLLEAPYRILADDMGLGKSVQAISAVETLCFRDKLSSILLVCPNSLLVNWTAELSKWTNWLSYEVLNMSIIKDFSSVASKLRNNNIALVSYSSLPTLAGFLENGGSALDLIVADEAHKLRNETSGINNAFRKLKRKRCWLLTGTPLERDTDDIRHMLACLDPTDSGALRRVNDVIFKAKLSAVSLRRLKADILEDLPPVQRRIENLPMGKAQADWYRSVLRKMVRVPAQERIGFLTKLSFAAIVSEGGDSCKFDRALEIIELGKKWGRKSIVFSNFNEALGLFGRRLSKFGTSYLLLTGEVGREERDRRIRSFKSEESNTCLLVNSRVGGEGITLTEASIVIFLNEWWNASSNRQAEDRVNRIGQKERVSIYVLRSQDTIDENVGEILQKKVKLERAFVGQLVKDIIR